MKILIAAALACSTLADPPVEQKKLLTQVGAMIEQQHYLVPVINDDFSEGIWEAYFHLLDGKKCVFLQEDADQLKRYEHYLDNELHGDSILFFPAITRLYAKRYTEAASIYQRILSRPFTFGKKDSIASDQEPASFPKTQQERIQRWNDLLKVQVFEKLTALKELRAQSISGDALYRKTDKQLEQLARESLLKQNDRMLARFRSFDESKLFSNYLNTITRYADPHSDYFPPMDKQAFDQSMTNRFFGIGAQLKEEDGNIVIVALDAGSPSWKSNAFAVNDQIVKVGQGSDGPLTDVTGMALSDVVKLIRGNKGSTVRIGYRKADGRVMTVPLVREEIRQEEAAARSAVIWKDGKKTGYIYLPVFYDDFGRADGAHCADDVAREVMQLKAEKVSGIIIDLRNNGGGSLAQVIKMVGLFTGRGPVVQVRASDGREEVLRSEQAEAMYNGPLTVMVNELSASASEIFAAAMQDYKRGVIIGSATLGKGTVQRTLPLGAEEYGAVKLTTQKFYRISGSATQQKGVIPDIVLPDMYETLGLREGNRPSALNWDRIPSAEYMPKGNTNIDLLAMQAEERMAEDTVFKIIAANNTWLENYIDAREQGMPLSTFREQLLQRRKIARQNELLLRLPETEKMDVRARQGASGASYEKWLQSIAGDVYVKQALCTSLDMKE